MEALMSVIMLWLSLTFDLPVASEYPHVRFVEPPQITALHSGVLAAREHTIIGIYDSRSRTIFLRDDWDSRNVADVSVLVHELVHYLEDRVSLRHECAGGREALAYDAQQRWLKTFGKDLQSTFGLDAFTLKLRTACSITRRTNGGKVRCQPNCRNQRS